MSKRKPSDIATSVRQRLLNRIRETGEDADLVWLRHAVERLLYRLSAWNYGRDFVFKGAALFLVWRGQPHWPTLDVDMLSRGEDSSEYVEKVFPKVCQVEVEPEACPRVPGLWVWALRRPLHSRRLARANTPQA